MKGRAVTTKSDFSEEQWSRIVRAPFGAGLAISLADPSGPIEAAKESMATVKSATNPSSREQLVTEVALDIQAEVQQKRNPLRGYRPSLEGTAPSGEQVLVELSAVQAIVATQATPEETAAFGQWLVASAQAAANAAKEGGFVGFGAAQVSKGEREMLDQVRAAVSQGLTGPGAKSICSTRASAIECFCCRVHYRIVRRPKEGRLTKWTNSLAR
jgi:hypothetical protein